MLDTFQVWHGHPIGILYYKFNSLDTNALQDHLVDTLSNGQFTDVSGRPRSPYFTNTAFLASPLIADDEVFEKGNHTFFIDSRFFLQNAGAHVTQVRVDFGDGQGEWIVNNPFDTTATFQKGINRPMGIVSSITKNLGFTILGRIIVVIVDIFGYSIEHSNPFKITVSGGKGPNDYAQLSLCKGGENPSQRWVIEAPQARLAPINSIYGNPQLDYTTKIEAPCSSIPGFTCKVKVPVKDTAYFYFAGNGSSCNRNVLHKPIVFIDGFDPTNSRGVKQIFEEYINKGVRRNGLDVAFGDYMLSQGYEFIILDYKHGNDLMERNAMTLVSLLERLYQTYGATFQQDITLIGPSMGSEIAQYALAYMEHNGIPHHVKTYISFDGPQQGANVPIGLQNMVEYLTKRGLLSKLNAVKSTVRNGLYNGLAARQLLAHHVSANATFPTPDALRTKFLSNLQAVGEYPSQCRKVALINGLSNGTLNPDHLTPNESLIHIINKRKGWKSLWGVCNWNVCKNLDWDAKAAPSVGTAKVSDMWTLNPIINLIFWVPPFETNKYASAAWGNSSLDNAPGSAFGPVFGTLPGNVSEDKIRFLAKELFYLLTGSRRTTFTQNINNFSFVPSYRAADLRFPTMTNNSGKNLYMNWSQTNLCGHTPFDFVYVPTDVNQRHVAVSQQGSEWFESEAKCNVADLPVLVSPIGGLQNLCVSENYSISFCKTGNHTITWTVSNPSIATISGSGNQVTLTRTGNGIITLTAKISYPCVVNGTALSTTVSKQITAGQTKPGPLNWTWNLPPGRILLQVSPVAGATSYQWYLNGILKATTSEAVYRMPINGNVSCGNYYYFGVKSVGLCGVSDESYVYAEMPPCNFAYKVSPNPAADNINIEPINQYDESGNKKAATIHTIEIYDKMGVMKLRKKLATLQATANISVASLISDVYNLHVFDGQNWQSCKIIVQH